MTDATNNSRNVRSCLVVHKGKSDNCGREESYSSDPLVEFEVADSKTRHLLTTGKGTHNCKGLITRHERVKRKCQLLLVRQKN